MKQKSLCHGPFCILLAVDFELDLDVVEVDLAAADLAAFLAAIRNLDKFFSIAEGDDGDSAVDAEVDLVAVAFEEDVVEEDDDFAATFLSTALSQPTFDNEQPPDVDDDLAPLDFLTWLMGGCFFFLAAAALVLPTLSW